ncbi:metalloregulator ArsR/SmtB family transcription factor [Pelagibacterium sp. H642]|uniref:ArsR/SmtB family transcription factor n=1 Tax=Pelagibacterium sp. H642 TaxID=1881069 RepID=UPI0028157798|nr:metalloregulator ArsR/SmtB family transcription factor [Pelagibacterium sp. H642]WMT92717.1 metalloregulator ArsR/SmtB family transcription factor [Pelagibacterium sp. H642]
MPDMQTTFNALADPSRRAILARLNEGEATVSQLVELFDLTQPTVSSHLKVLERARLIVRGKDAQRRPCRLDPAGFKALSQWLEGYAHFWDGTLDSFVAHAEQEARHHKEQNYDD